MDRIATEKETLTERVRTQATLLGRIRTELNLDKDADADAWAAALKELRTRTVATPPTGTPPATNGDGTFTQTQLNEAMSEGKAKADAEYQGTIKTLTAEREAADTRWKQDRVDTDVSVGCASHNPPLRSTLLLAILRNKSHDWELVANPDGPGTRVITKGDETLAPYYSKDLMKHMALDDVLTVIAKEEPGIQLVHPKPGTLAGQGVRSGPSLLLGTDPSQMSAEEKIKGAFPAQS